MSGLYGVALLAGISACGRCHWVWFARYHLAHLRAIRHLNVAAEEQDRLFAYFRSLTDGAKELRLNRNKRSSFYDDVLGRSIEIVRHERTFGMSLFIASAGWGNFLIYAFIGMVLFAGG